ncbi:MAG: bL21 family ribosomal protein, partial [Gemmatimonadaceae bacterium]
PALDAQLTVLKDTRRKTSARKQGHRQKVTEVRLTDIPPG